MINMFTFGLFLADLGLGLLTGLIAAASLFIVIVIGMALQG